MIDKEILASTLEYQPFPFPHEGDLTLAVRNDAYGLGPAMLHIAMKAGSVIPAHIHNQVAEVLYVADGDFINEGKNYPTGTSFHIKPGVVHGPHGTKNGCNLLVLWTDKSMSGNAGLDDFIIPSK